MDTTTPKSAAVAVTIEPRLSTSLPKLFRNSSTRLITQGAEAVIYQTSYLIPSLPCALKYRPSKTYRHPTLDARLTKHRILSEARVLARCRTHGVSVPAVYALDEKDGWLLIEWIHGEVVREKLNLWLSKHQQTNPVLQAADFPNIEDDVFLKDLMRKIGAAVGKMHSIGVIHGDLTTSNLMLKSPPRDPARDKQDEEKLGGDIILIDFGLSNQSSQDEDRAVDLYVLERAFSSSHPQTGTIFNELLLVYGKSYKGANQVLKKLEEVRMRGRKRSMLG
ncbi:EKC/KEOPS complex subunit BUD32 [Golovinomyces cichoracearum]|uniref:EKC/KEOPS complex subunit BUD32 n=1 Tax=Golovinomyces cichoracearum TaxID=62708 RepID=A0A420J337_9PEZI|nr:EKC/KEOPS complex subunit BUD32 [Golovinomyces cichoracearum]